MSVGIREYVIFFCSERLYDTVNLEIRTTCICKDVGVVIRLTCVCAIRDWCAAHYALEELMNWNACVKRKPLLNAQNQFYLPIQNPLSQSCHSLRNASLGGPHIPFLGLIKWSYHGWLLWWHHQRAPLFSLATGPPNPKSTTGSSLVVCYEKVNVFIKANNKHCSISTPSKYFAKKVFYNEESRPYFYVPMRRCYFPPSELDYSMR